MLKKYDENTLGSGSDDYARWTEIKARITNIAEKKKSMKYSQVEIENELINSIQNMDYVEANKKLDEISKGSFWGNPIYKKNIDARREEEKQLINKDLEDVLKKANIDKSKFLNLLRQGAGDKKIKLDYVQDFITNVVGFENLKNPESLESQVLQDMIEYEISITKDKFDKAMAFAKKQMENK